MKNTTVIIPIHKINEEILTFLKRAIESVDKEKNEIILVGPNDVLMEVKNLYEDATLIVNEDTDVYTQINKAAMQCVTEYFTVLEFDDILLHNWNKLELEAENNTVVLPINEYVEMVKGNPVFKAFGNEIGWDAAFFEEDKDGNINVGHLTEHELKIYNDFNVTGALIRTEDFISLGLLKPEYKILTWFEFLMRVARSGKGIYVLPRVCYSHTVLREDSYMQHINDIVTPEEVSEKLKEILGEEEGK